MGQIKARHLQGWSCTGTHITATLVEWYLALPYFYISIIFMADGNIPCKKLSYLISSYIYMYYIYNINIFCSACIYFVCLACTWTYMYFERVSCSLDVMWVNIWLTGWLDWSTKQTSKRKGGKLVLGFWSWA